MELFIKSESKQTIFFGKITAVKKSQQKVKIPKKTKKITFKKIQLI